MAGLGVDAGEDVLEHGLGVGEIFAGDAVQLPQDARLADGQQRFFLAMVDQHAVEDFVQVEGLAGRMVVPPFQCAGFGVQCQGRVGIVGGAAAAAAQIAPPRLGLGGAPVGGVEFGIISARHPGLDAFAVIVGHAVPAVAAGLAGQCHGDELPIALAGLCVIGADVAMVGSAGAGAVGHAHQNPALDDDQAASGIAQVGIVVDLGLPHFLAGARVEGIEPALRRVDVEIVAIESHGAGFFG